MATEAVTAEVTAEATVEDTTTAVVDTATAEVTSKPSRAGIFRAVEADMGKTPISELCHVKT